MKISICKHSIYFSIAIGLFFSACKKKGTFSKGVPEITFSQDSVLTVPINTSISIVAKVSNGVFVRHYWFYENEALSISDTLHFKASKAGQAIINYAAVYEGGHKDYRFTINTPVPVKEATAASSAFISQVFDFLPGPGQQVNKAIANKEAAKNIIGAEGGLLSLGSFGGYVVFGFDHSIKNGVGADLGIQGNPNASFSEPGIVMVSQDLNGNALPDDEWFELAGSDYNAKETIHNYEVTYYNPKKYAAVPWKDNYGHSGVVAVNTFHRQNYYPEFATNLDSISFKGTLMKNTSSQQGSFYSNFAFDWGYTDSYSTSEIDNYNLNNNFNHFDLDWAVDAKGIKMKLNSIDFVKVYTSQLYSLGWLGEVSTEITKAKDLHIK